MPSSESLEVRQAFEILDSLMSRANAHIVYPFLDAIDPEALGLIDYRKIVQEPMWLNKMSETFRDGDYRSIHEFVCDFRLMLFNCYLYNGVTSRMGRMAEKLELLFEQKLQLLSPEIRSKTSIQSTLGSETVGPELSDCDLPRRRSSSRLFMSGDSRHMTPMRAIAEELEHSLQPDSSGITTLLLSTGVLNEVINSEGLAALLIRRLCQWRVRREDENLLQTWQAWWTEQGGLDSLAVVQRTPEFLEIYQFLWLADPFLGITDCLTRTSALVTNQSSHSDAPGLGLFELELAVAVAPRSSQLLAICMTNLLATPKERSQMVSALSNPPGGNEPIPYFPGHRRHNQQATVDPLMALDYDTWERRLADLVGSWYRLLWSKGKGSSIWAARRLGLPTWFFERCGSQKSPLERMRFHELPVYIRIQLFHALCESVIRTFDNLRGSMDREADWDASRPVVLGEDMLEGMSYVHFPGMFDSEPAVSCRIYRMISVSNCPIDIPDRLVETDSGTPEDVAADLPTTTAEQDVPKVKGRRKSRRARFNPAPKTSVAIAEHDRLLSRVGLPVPGPVKRLPSWLPPPLSRSTCRRWYHIAEKLHSDVIRAGAKPMNKTDKQQWGYMGVSWFEQFLDFQIGYSESKPFDFYFKIPYPAFEATDKQKMKTMLAENPLLNPSPFALMNGFSRRFLSIQLARGSSARIHPKKTKRSANDKQPTASENDGAESVSSVSVSQHEEMNSSSSDEEQTIAEPEQCKNLPEDADQEEKGNWLDNLDNLTPCPSDKEKVKSGSNPVSAEASSESEEEAVVGEVCSTQPCEETDKETLEPLLTGPEKDEFAVVAEDIDSLRALLDKLNASLTTLKNQSIGHDRRSHDRRRRTDTTLSSSDPEYFDSSWSCKLCRYELGLDPTTIPSSLCEHDCSVECARRRDRAKQNLECLISSLEGLVPTMLDSGAQREEARQQVRLRLRKEVIAWKAKEENPLAATQPEVDESTSVSAPSDDLAKERAERQRRREQLRYQEYLDSPSLGTGDKTAPPENVVPQVDHTQVNRPTLSKTFTDVPAWKVDLKGGPDNISIRKVNIPSTSQNCSLSKSTAQPSLSSPTPRLYPLTSVPKISHPQTIIRFPTDSHYRVLRPVYPSSSSTGGVESNGPRPNPPTISSQTNLTNSAPTARRIYRVFDNLFTEDAHPVRIDANGVLQPLPLDSVPSEHRLVAVRMIEKYKNFARSSQAQSLSVSAPKRVAVTMGQPEQH